MMMFYLLISALLVISLNSVVINTNYGAIEGSTDGGVNKFIGIPYAKPPINELRFADPVEAEAWSDTFAATGHPALVPNCPQGCYKNICPTGALSEDCLFLNIFTPDTAQYQVTNYNVMVWIHGGAFVVGASTDITYDGSAFVGFIGDTIIVSLNYRLGLLGLLYDNKYNTGIEGNFAFKDQQLAIKWVYENIEFFGGNKDNIIIFGESAGAQYVGLHLLYNKDGYIKGGIMQSAPFGYPLRTPSTWFDTIDQFTDIVGCDDETLSSLELLDCWRSVEFHLILAAQENELLYNSWNNELEKFTPTVETQLLEKQPVAGFSKINNNKDNMVPFIIGVNKDEYYLFAEQEEIARASYSYTDLVNELDRYFFGDNDLTQSVLDYYGITSSSPGIGDKYIDDLSEILTKGGWKCPAQRMLKKAKKVDNVYYYQFDVIDTLQNTFLFGQLAPQCIPKSCHVAELYYLWTPPFFQAYGLLFPKTINIGHQMQQFWSNWAKSLNPNNVGQDIWNVYTNNGPQKRQFLRIKDENEYITDSFNGNDDECEFWDDKVGYAVISENAIPMNPAFDTPPSSLPYTINLSSSTWIWMMAAFLIIILTINICLFCKQILSKKGSGYISVKHIDSECYDSEKNPMNP